MFFPVLSFLQSVFMLLIIYVIEEVKVTCEKIIYNFIKSKSVAIFIYFFNPEGDDYNKTNLNEPRVLITFVELFQKKSPINQFD